MENSNIKSIEELEKRIRGGKEIYIYNRRVFYSFAHLLKGESPYRINRDNGEDAPLNSYWYEFKEFQVKKKWYETVSKEKPVLCRTHQYGNEFALIVGYHPENNSKFECFNKCFHRCAEPITSDSPYIYKEEK